MAVRPPEGFRVERGAGLCSVVREDLQEAAGRAGLLDPRRLRALLEQGGGARGRGTTAVVALPGRAERVVLRPLRRGGALGPVLGGALPGPGRPLREIAVTAALRSAGAPVPAPALAVAWRRGPWWNAVVGTVLVENARDAVAFLESHPSRHAVVAAARAVGRAVRAFHDAGGIHPDLHVKNLLLRANDGGYDAIVVDLDRARRVEAVPADRRMRELMRLYRSLRKRGLLERVEPRGVAAAFGAYVGGNRALRRALRRHLARERARMALHAWRYRGA